MISEGRGALYLIVGEDLGRYHDQAFNRARRYLWKGATISDIKLRTHNSPRLRRYGMDGTTG